MHKAMRIFLSISLLFMPLGGLIAEETGAAGPVPDDVLAFVQSIGKTFTVLAEQLSAAENAAAAAEAFDTCSLAFDAIAAAGQALKEKYGVDVLDAITENEELRKLIDVEYLLELSGIIGALTNTMTTYGEDPLVVEALERWQLAAESMEQERPLLF